MARSMHCVTVGSSSDSPAKRPKTRPSSSSGLRFVVRRRPASLPRWVLLAAFYRNRIESVHRRVLPHDIAILSPRIGDAQRSPEPI